MKKSLSPINVLILGVLILGAISCRSKKMTRQNKSATEISNQGEVTDTPIGIIHLSTEQKAIDSLKQLKPRE